MFRCVAIELRLANRLIWQPARTAPHRCALGFDRERDGSGCRRKSRARAAATMPSSSRRPVDVVERNPTHALLDPQPIRERPAVR